MGHFGRRSWWPSSKDAVSCTMELSWTLGFLSGRLSRTKMCPCTENQTHMVLEKGEGNCPITLQNCWFAFKSMVSSGCKFKSKKMYIRYKVYTEWYIKVDDVRFFVFLLLYCSLAPSGALIAIPT